MDEDESEIDKFVYVSDWLLIVCMELSMALH